MIRGIQEAFSRLLAVFRHRTLDQDFDEELSAHLDLLIDHNQRRGLPLEEARRQAILRMGGVSSTRQLHREARGLPRAESVVQASWQAWRSWRSAKLVALFATTALAVGIGSATAIYSVVNAVMLKPLPYASGDRFVALFGADSTDPARFSTLLFEDAQKYEQRTRAFDAFGWFRGAGKNLMFAGEPHVVQGVAVTPSLVEHLGVEPVLGQWFRDDSSAVISSALWRRLGADPGIIGKALTLDGAIYTVTGVMPESFHLPIAGITSAASRTDVWMPLDMRERVGAAYLAYGRRKPGVTLRAAEEDVRRVAAEIAAEDPRRHPTTYTARLFDLRETVIRDIRPTLLLLFAAAGLLFLITCANAAGLLLARSIARARETAMRVALGANGAQLAVHSFAEGLLIALGGAVGGVFLALTLTSAIVSLAADYLPRADEIAVDWTVLVFALGAALVASVLASVAPLRQAARTAPADVLGEGIRASAGRRGRRASRSLVVAEIALAFALLAVGAVLIAHVRTLANISPGFDADRMLTFTISVPGTIARDAQKRVPLQRRLVEEFGRIPGVEAVALASQLPFKHCCRTTTIYPEGRPVSVSASQRTNVTSISPGYFSAMGIPLRSGRVLTDLDYRPPDRSVVINHVRSVVINEAAAERYWGGHNPVGAYGTIDDPAGLRFQVVGVVRDVRNDGLSNPTVPEIYRLAVYQSVEGMHFVVRSSQPAASLVADMRRVVRAIDPELPIFDVVTMREAIQRTMTLERAASFLTAFFAGTALLMAMFGIYGMVSYSIRQRTVEIGLRMALGATSWGVLSLVVGEGLRLAAYGVLVGSLAAIGAASYLDRVFQIGEIGLVPFLCSAALVAVGAFAASFFPAWRAALLSPLVAIRN